MEGSEVYQTCDKFRNHGIKCHALISRTNLILASIFSRILQTVIIFLNILGIIYVSTRVHCDCTALEHFCIACVVYGFVTSKVP
jgi:hypothetical protein